MNRNHISRRKFFFLSSAGTAMVLAACGPEQPAGTPEDTPAAPPGTAEGGPEVAPGEPIASEAEVPENSAFPFTDADTGQPAVLVHLSGGEFVAYSAVCTHQQCTVAYQEETQRLACPCHGSVFIPDQGAQVETGPAPSPLPEIEVEVRNGEVYRA
ncbi:ubiquinol-cytochrome c reductase iron-sulfur subunit [Rubrobacter taiwanensis]|uniref:QcrA and Rieske domain-containing protein n=1 Tax=Rubrobacter taiwanensis TaxID=185139 RepID=UPI001405107C|nr:Rieske (2Fe-2S) protein [Rubrobacter taiwanensis]